MGDIKKYRDIIIQPTITMKKIKLLLLLYVLCLTATAQRVRTTAVFDADTSTRPKVVVSLFSSAVGAGLLAHGGVIRSSLCFILIVLLLVYWLLVTGYWSLD